jgi:hypothetical protein
MNSNFFQELQRVREMTARTNEVLGLPYSDIFNEEATIYAVADPKQLGRVKVQYNDGIVTDWCYVLGSGRGQLTAQFIGSKCLVAKASGNAENAFVLGIFNTSANYGQVGNPSQIPIISDQTALFANPDDGGLKCHKGNGGRQYILSGEMGQDHIICMQRNIPQVDGTSEEVWSWKSLTHSKWIDKGYDPGAAKEPLAAANYKNNPGIPKCDKGMLGEIHEFSEDRNFRSYFITCVQNEDKGYSWVPISSTPTFFKTTLPKCNDSIHGFNAILDDGGNSEFIVCSRYQGKMLWTKQGQRIPIKFHKLDAPISNEKFLSSYKPIPALSLDGVSQDVTNKMWDVVLGSVPATATDPALHQALERALMLPPKYLQSDVLKSVAQIFIENKTGMSLSDIIVSLSEGSADQQITINKLGDLSNTLLDGVRNNNVSEVLQDVGKGYLGQAIDTLSPDVASIYTSYMASGALGAIDTAVALGKDILPDGVAKFVSPILSVGKDILKGRPATYRNILNSAVNGGLNTVVNDIIGAVKTEVGPIVTKDLGPIADMFKGFSNLDAVKKIKGFTSDLGPGLPRLATTALALIGQGSSFKNFLGVGGIGFDAVKALTGRNPVTTILGGIGNLFGLGKNKSNCPCDPKCRKTSHGVDADGNNLLEKCGALVANNANSYNPTGNPLKNNIGDVAKTLGTIATGVGLPLSLPNMRDLTQFVSKIPRVGKMAQSLFNARNADLPEFMAEMAYTAEAIQNTFKQTDNNITRVESINRKMIDSLHSLIRTYMGRGGKGAYNRGVIPELIRAVRDNAQSVKDLYAYVESLDHVKTGPRVGVKPTPSITRSIRNINGLGLLAEINRKEALKILARGIAPADKEWRSLQQGNSDVNLSNYRLGQFSPSLPEPFPNISTYFDENRILNIALESVSDGTEDTPLGLTMSPDNLDEYPDLTNEQKTANSREADCS